MRRSAPAYAVGVLVALYAAAAWGQDFFQQSPGPLAQSHADLEGQDKCGQCHTSGKDLSNDKCLACHDHADQKKKIDAGRGFHSSPKIKGRTCQTCHLDHKGKNYDLMGWSSVGGEDKFDHGQTDFPLEGKHATLPCTDCHKRKNKAGLKIYLGEDKVCGSCHKDDQPHRFERVEMMKCDRCHSEVAWKPGKKSLDFDHNDKKQASFPLEGSHADVACAKCHPKSEFNLEKNVEQCSACHDNAHKGQLFETKDCDSCHSPKFGKLAKISFDHDRKTKFALTGEHKTTACYSCHPQTGKKKPARECESCHARDNHHKDRFDAYGKPEPNCATCHPTSSWIPNQFEHNKKTNFALTAMHAKAQCRDCHRGKEPFEFERFDMKKNGCMGCHEHAKVHGGQYKNSECLSCHKPGELADVKDPGGKINKELEKAHGSGARFQLRHAHAKVNCQKCHKNSMWKGLSVECGDSCHVDSLHKGTLGKECSRCHTGGIWRATRFDHDKDSDYKLIGNHVTKATCEGCHPKRVYKPTPTTCGDERCHREDDAHNGKLGFDCGECHVPTGANIFNHNKQSDYILDNAHLAVPCRDCHPSIEFKPRPKDCFGCHPEPDVHKGLYGTACEGCHDTVAWDRIKPVHDVGSFVLGGAHDAVDCRRCHNMDLRPLAGTGTMCIRCHREDDIHGNSLGPQCGKCHTQWTFAAAKFDHTTVGCDLRGQHRTLPCFDCHKAGNFGGLLPTCFSCHRDDAVKVKAASPDHKLQAACGGCHNMNTWYPANMSAAGSESVCR